MGHDEGVIESKIKKTKRTLKKICCCGISWFLVGLIALALGIAFLATWGKYWGDETKTERGLAYAGLALLLLGIILLGIGITFCVALYTIYKRLNSDDFARAQFKPPKYEYGKAPYPQQPQASPVHADGVPPSAPPEAYPPSAPLAEKPPADQGDVSIEVSEHTKF